MKPKIHPKWYPGAKVTCACGNVWTVGSTVKEMKVDVCSKCHPFFTGEQRIVDTEGQVDRFMRRLSAREDAIRDVERRKAQRVSPEVAVAELGLNTRAEAALREAGLLKVADILKRLEEQGDTGLTDIKGFGLKALADLKKILRGRGFILPGDEAIAQAA